MNQCQEIKLNITNNNKNKHLLRLLYSLGTPFGGPVASILAVAKSPHGANSLMARTVGPSEYLAHGLDQSPHGAKHRDK